MTDQLEGKVIVVTGVSSGIGRATAIRLADEGASVVVAARRIDESQKVVEEITARGGAAVFSQTDVTQESDVEAMVGTAIDTFGKLDGAFNNAGRLGGRPEPWHEVGSDIFDEFIDTNLRGVWLCMKHELRVMREHGGGSIVNNSSIGGFKGGPANAHIYAASKHGVVGLTRNAAMNYGKNGIRVNAVCPGIIANQVWLDRFKLDPDRETSLTNRIPLGRLGTENEIADAVIWLCSDSSAYVTGTALVVDGGMTENVMP
jgi:NAD(P)-dependent dehydrogenase (short-subunit alcohol dehydrogenase family)